MSGISDGDNGTQILTITATSNSNATAVATIDGSGNLTAITPTGPVTSIAVNAGGTNYTTADSANPLIVTISPPVSGGTTAEATATVVGGVITGFTIINPGSGYTVANPPTITISGGDGTGAMATAFVTAGGSNYLTPPTVTLSGGGFTNPATATAILGTGSLAGTIIGFSINSPPNANYSSPPTVTIAPSLISNPTINYVNGSSTAILSYTPVPGNSGVTTITVVGQDNGGTANGGLDSATISFTVTINPNNAPTINPVTTPPLTCLSIPANSAAQTITLTGITNGDAGSIQTLTVTATSSNPSLIPTPTITYTSPNSTGTLTFTPVPTRRATPR